MDAGKNIVELFETEVLSKIGPRGKKVIMERFGIGTRPPKTLEEIGSSFDSPVTRERVRQIQEVSLFDIGRITGKVPELLEIRHAAETLLKGANDGFGVTGQERLVSETIAKLGLPADDMDVRGVVNVLLHAEFNIGRSRPILGVRPYFYDLSNPKLGGIRNIRKAFLECIPKNEAVPVEGFYQKVSELTGYEPKDIAAIAELFPEVVIGEGQAAKEKARILNPKTLRSKSGYVLRNSGKPMHFREITAVISEKWPAKEGHPVKAATVHNELIRNAEFVLVGRGIYALRAWGYQPGTVLSVVVQALEKNGGPMSVEDITKAVRKKRQVKEATVYMNLQNKKFISRVGRKLYALNPETAKTA